MAKPWERQETGGVRWTLRAQAAAEIAQRLPAGLGPALAVASARRHRSFHEVATPQGGLFVKRLAYPKLDASLLLRIALSRVRGAREFRTAVRAHARGAAVPEPLAFGVRRQGLRGYESLLVYRRLPPASRTLAELQLESRTQGERAGYLAALAALAAGLHERGVFHLDLTAKNVVRTGGSDAAPQLVAVDLETARIGPRRSLALAARSLARIEERFPWARPEERERFFALYLEGRERVSAPALCRRLARARRRRRPRPTRGAQPLRSAAP